MRSATRKRRRRREREMRSAARKKRKWVRGKIQSWWRSHPRSALPPRCNHRACGVDFKIGTLRHFLKRLSYLLRIPEVSICRLSSLTTHVIADVALYRTGLGSETVHIRRKPSGELYLYPNEWRPALNRAFNHGHRVRSEHYFSQNEEWMQYYLVPRRGNGILISRVMT